MLRWLRRRSRFRGGAIARHRQRGPLPPPDDRQINFRVFRAVAPYLSRAIILDTLVPSCQVVNECTHLTCHGIVKIVAYPQASDVLPISELTPGDLFYFGTLHYDAGDSGPKLLVRLGPRRLDPDYRHSNHKAHQVLVVYIASGRVREHWVSDNASVFLFPNA